jgi:hypothetical protein
MQLVNVLAFPDGVYVLVKCKCGAIIKQRRAIYRVICPECHHSVPVSDLKELKRD